MGRDYIPFKDAEFDEWLQRFADYIAVHYAELGLSITDRDNIVAGKNKWKTDYQAHMTVKNAARGAKENKNHTRKTNESLSRNLAQRITVYPGTTNGNRESLNITVPDTKPTPIAPDYVAQLAPPLLLLDWSQRGQVLVHFGVNPGNEKQNAKPKDILGVRISYRQKGEDWQFLSDDTNSPYTHSLDITEPQNVEYRVQWFDKKMRLGAFGDTAKCTVSP